MAARTTAMADRIVHNHLAAAEAAVATEAAYSLDCMMEVVVVHIAEVHCRSMEMEAVAHSSPAPALGRHMDWVLRRLAPGTQRNVELDPATRTDSCSPHRQYQTAKALPVVVAEVLRVEVQKNC
jgi:hypothetical protein